MNHVNWQEISEFKQAEASPGFLLWQVSCKWRREIESCLKRFNLTHSQFVILACTGWLTRFDQNISQVDIARQSKIDIATTSQIIRVLERKDYLNRKQIKGDERSKYPFLTKKGAKLLERSLPEVEKIDRQFFAALKNKLVTFNKLLRILAKD